MREETYVIGGYGLIVEIDESMVFKRKNNIGRLTTNEASKSWVFGGLCRETGETFIEAVQSRDRKTLFEVIRRRIAPGTSIMSDSWKAYLTLSKEGYHHEMVNHSHNFLSPDDPRVNTQRIERAWRTLKSIIPSGCHGEDRWSYLAEYTFKQRIGWYTLSIGERIDKILTALSDISF